MHYNGLKLSGVLKSFLPLHDFLVQKFKNQLFEENKRFECSLYVQVISNLPSRHEKHQTLDILLMTEIFNEFLKIDNFPNFPKFRKRSAAYTKIIVCVLSYVNMCVTKPHATS